MEPRWHGTPSAWNGGATSYYSYIYPPTYTILVERPWFPMRGPFDTLLFVRRDLFLARGERASIHQGRKGTAGPRRLVSSNENYNCGG